MKEEGRGVNYRLVHTSDVSIVIAVTIISHKSVTTNYCESIQRKHDISLASMFVCWLF